MKKLKMRFKQKSIILISSITALILISLLTRCTVMSFYPLYTPDDLIRDDRIMGKWISRLTEEEVTKDSIIWEISFKDKKWKKKVNNPVDKGSKEVKNKMTYKLKLYPANDPEQFAEFNIHIVKINNDLFLDFLIDEIETDFIFTVIHLMPVHTFAKLEIGEELTVKWFDGDFLEDLLESNKIRIRHEKRDDASLLTAKPKELQKFISKYADHEDAYLEDLSFVLWKTEL